MDFQISIDANHPPSLADFWMLALDYIVQPPPPEFDSWDDWARAVEIPEERWDDARALVDPNGRGPRLFLQKVPEGKTAKNRFHLDINATAGFREDPEAAVAALHAHAEKLEAAGATRIEEIDTFQGHWIVMQDPEGNEFCVQ